MTNAHSVLQELIRLSHALGRPERDLVILGEGNTSARCDDGTFWVKGSGTQLRTVEADGFVRMNADYLVSLVERESMSDDEFKTAMQEGKVDPSQARRPSTETVMHALALTETDAQYVGHTHPIAVNAIMCSVAAEEAVSGVSSRTRSSSVGRRPPIYPTPIPAFNWHGPFATPCIATWISGTCPPRWS